LSPSPLSAADLVVSIQRSIESRGAMSVFRLLQVVKICSIDIYENDDIDDDDDK
jgi:hypothetical protein